MNRTYVWGRAIFAAAMGALGVQCAIRGDAVPALELVRPYSVAHPVIAWLTALALVAGAGAAMVRATARIGAALLALVLLLWLLFLQLPELAAAPRNGGLWTTVFEVLALGGAALVLLALAPDDSIAATIEWTGIARRARTVGRLAFGLSLPAFGVLHFLYPGYVSSVIPGWLGAPVFWTYATGVAHVAAGVAIVTRVMARLAALCAAAMFGSWVVILHAPRVFAHQHDANEWTSMLIALGMCGGALLVAAASDVVLSGAKDLHPTVVLSAAKDLH
jgi:uncharacterized membrane protein YphA (DoxX/SURF4 family)